MPLAQLHGRVGNVTCCLPGSAPRLSSTRLRSCHAPPPLHPHPHPHPRHHHHRSKLSELCSKRQCASSSSGSSPIIVAAACTAGSGSSSSRTVASSSRPCTRPAMPNSTAVARTAGVVGIRAKPMRSCAAAAAAAAAAAGSSDPQATSSASTPSQPDSATTTSSTPPSPWDDDHTAPSSAAAAAPVSPGSTTASSSSAGPAVQAGAQGPPATSYRGTAVVVGAGPAGATAAMYLARSGYRVHVVERRGHPAAVEADKKRTYLIGLGERGLRALDGLGMTVPLSVGRPMRGSVYAYKSGKRVEDPFTHDTRIVGVDRQGLSAFLVDEAARRHTHGTITGSGVITDSSGGPISHPGGTVTDGTVTGSSGSVTGSSGPITDGSSGPITFHWGVSPSSFDLAGKRLTCSRVQDSHGDNSVEPGSPGSPDEPDVPQQLHYDLLVGADGAGSAVREAMTAALPGMKVERLTSPVAEMEYKAFHNLPWNESIAALLPHYPTAPAAAAAAPPAAAAPRAAAAPAAAAAAAATKPSLRPEAQATASNTAAAANNTAAAAAAANNTAAAAAAAPNNTAAAADPGMTFFAFNNPQPNQPNPGSITLYLNAAGSWSGTLYQPPGRFGGMTNDESGHESAIRQFTPPGFPEDWVPQMAGQMAGMSPSRISPMHLVSDLAAPSLGVVLLGDAGHNVTPQMGQGCNSALEDAAMLDQALQQADYDVAAGLQRYQQQRMPQVHALQHMEEEKSWVRRPPVLLQDPLDKTLARIAWISFFSLLPLLRLLPGMKRAVHASLFQTIMSTTVPYDRLHAAIRAAPFVLGLLLAGLVWGGRALVGLGLRALAS